MKSKSLNLITLLLCASLLQSCMTTYDAKGYPVQSVHPGVAVAGVVAAGALGYAISQNNNCYQGYRGYRPYCPYY